MSLRLRLTLIYGTLLALVFVALGIGSEVVMQGRFSDQARSNLNSAANQVFINYTDGGSVWSKKLRHYLFRYALPLTQEPFTGDYLEMVSPKGRVIGVSNSLKPDHLNPDLQAVRAASVSRISSFKTITFSGNLLEVYYTPMPPGNASFLAEPDVLLVAKSESDVSHALDVFNAALFSGEAFIWLLAVVVTWLVSGSALRPIKGMTERAAGIADTSDFAGRVPVDTRTAELQTLAVTFNRMLESLQRAYANQQRFLADASHELRTPLTVLQGNLHYLEAATDAPGSEREEALHAARVEADRMGILVGDLLALGQADAGFGIQRDLVELDRVIIDAFRRIQSRERALRPERELQMKLESLEEIVVRGDSERLLQLVVILLDNAVKYTPDGGAVGLQLARTDDRTASIRVTDSGPGITDEERVHIFERFYRSKGARAKSEGSGLGLAIARWIAEAHGGEITFADRPEGGTMFQVTIPIAETDEPAEPISAVTEE